MGKITLGFIFGLFLIGNSVVGCASSLTDKEAYIIIDDLLELESQQSDMKASLRKYRKRGSLYLKYWEKVKGNPTEEELKIYLFLVFAVEKTGNAEMTEHISDNFLPVAKKNLDNILRILSDHHFLVPSTCHAINLSFQYAGVGEMEPKIRQQFLEKYKQKILNSLFRSGMDKPCLSEIK